MNGAIIFRVAMPDQSRNNLWWSSQCQGRL